ncbi:MAG: PTS sugar transporter subunit IIA [Desulfobacterota bacterium]|nr:PTS sugar transporter subunit IIA [Thermodesulfobacteriota bacterium]MDW8001941.1 PTS sugar transporter subunit IIA [Deltaproteobacteria bacterium]
MRLSDILKETCVLPSLNVKTKEEAIKYLVDHLHKQNLIPDPEEAQKVVMERERIGSTGIGDGVAIPHGRLKSLKNPVCALGVSQAGIDFDSVDGKPVHLIFLLFTPEVGVCTHLSLLSKISRIVKNSVVSKKITESGSAQKILEILKREAFDTEDG